MNKKGLLKEGLSIMTFLFMGIIGFMFYNQIVHENLLPTIRENTNNTGAWSALDMSVAIMNSLPYILVILFIIFIIVITQKREPRYYNY